MPDRLKSILSRRPTKGSDWEVVCIDWVTTSAESDTNRSTSEAGPRRRFHSFITSVQKIHFVNRYIITAGIIIAVSISAAVYLSLISAATENIDLSNAPIFDVSEKLDPIVNLETELIGADDNNENGQLEIYGKDGEIFSQGINDKAERWIKQKAAQHKILDNEERIWSNRDVLGNTILVTRNDRRVNSIYLLNRFKSEKLQTAEFQTSIHQSVLISGNMIRTSSDWTVPTRLNEPALDADCWQRSCVVALKNTYLWSSPEPAAAPIKWISIPIPDTDVVETKEVCVISSTEFIANDDNREISLWIKKDERNWQKESIYSAPKGANNLSLLWAMGDLKDRIVILALDNSIKDSGERLIEINIAKKNSDLDTKISYTELPANTEIKFVKYLGFKKLLLFTKTGLVYSYI